MEDNIENSIEKNELMTVDPHYKQWLTELKQRVLQSQLKAAVKVNSELLELYWQLGEDIVERQKTATWGDKLLAQLSKDLMATFPDMKGFSKRNLEQIRRWFCYWNDESAIAKQAVAQLVQIPWGHNIQIITKCQSMEEAAYYVQSTLEQGWSRNVLVHQIESGLWQREGAALHNFERTLPATQSDLAMQTLKDPYIFDFLNLSKQHSERELEQGLIDHITQFLLELGAGFAYMGRQYPIKVGERDFYIDLLFYHARLHCYVVIELKLGDFEPEHAGKLNFYIKAIDEQLCKQGDAPTIGILLCKTKDKVVAKYALSDINKPMGISEYKLTQSLPEALQSSLPSVVELEQLGGEHE
jgi:predicted nuclease of restriction endonuclease-like (RecB) superfamily